MALDSSVTMLVTMYSREFALVLRCLGLSLLCVLLMSDSSTSTAAVVPDTEHGKETNSYLVTTHNGPGNFARDRVQLFPQ